MSAPKFTPGPWMVARDGRTIDSDEHWVAETSAPSLATRHADARLIAAAPELYAALEAMVSSTCVGGHRVELEARGNEAFRLARVALAKARGE